MVFPTFEVFGVYIWHRDPEHGSSWCGSFDPIQDPIVAAGCGAPFAYGAMDAGATPVEAVKAACRRHTACALPVQFEAIVK